MDDILISVNLNTFGGDELLAAIDVFHEVADDPRHLVTVARVTDELQRRLDWPAREARVVATWLVNGLTIIRNQRGYRSAQMAREGLWKRLGGRR